MRPEGHEGDEQADGGREPPDAEDAGGIGEVLEREDGDGECGPEGDDAEGHPEPSMTVRALSSPACLERVMTLMGMTGRTQG